MLSFSFYKSTNALFILILCLCSSISKGQVFLKIDAVKGITLSQFDLAMEHRLGPSMTLHHQLNVPSILKQSSELGKPYQAVYTTEFRVYNELNSFDLFIGPALRLSAYQQFTDYEIGAAAGLRIHAKTRAYIMEIKLGASRSLNYQNEDSFNLLLPEELNIQGNIMIGIRLSD